MLTTCTDSCACYNVRTFERSNFASIISFALNIMNPQTNAPENPDEDAPKPIETDTPPTTPSETEETPVA